MRESKLNLFFIMLIIYVITIPLLFILVPTNVEQTIEVSTMEDQTYQLGTEIRVRCSVNNWTCVSDWIDEPGDYHFVHHKGLEEIEYTITILPYNYVYVKVIPIIFLFLVVISLYYREYHGIGLLNLRKQHEIPIFANEKLMNSHYLFFLGIYIPLFLMLLQYYSYFKLMITIGIALVLVLSIIQFMMIEKTSKLIYYIKKVLIYVLLIMQIIPVSADQYNVLRINPFVLFTFLIPIFITNQFEKTVVKKKAKKPLSILGYLGLLEALIIAGALVLLVFILLMLLFRNGGPGGV